MNIENSKNQENMILRAVKNFFSRLAKAPEEYPVKYYKKSKNYIRDRHAKYLF